MKWRQDFSTGFDHIDDQHKFLFEAVERFREMVKTGGVSRPYDVFLGFLATYGMVHFEVEERCMRVHQCPAATRNCLEHKAFRKMVEAECERFDRLGFERARANAFLGRIDRWLSSHVGQVDAQLRCTSSR